MKEAKRKNYKKFEIKILGKVNIAQILIINGADKNAGDHNGLTPLHLAVHRGNRSLFW